MQLSLSLFKPGVFLIDNVKFAFSPNNLAVGTSFLNGCSYFHVA